MGGHQIQTASRDFPVRLAIGLLLISAMLGNHACTSMESGVGPASGEAAFAQTVKPLLEHRCAWCHDNEAPTAGLNLQDRDLVLNPSLGFLVPGKPDQSSLYQAVERDSRHMNVMPADGWGVTAAQKQALHDWIAAGAPWPDGEAGEIVRKDYRVDFDDYP